MDVSHGARVKSTYPCDAKSLAALGQRFERLLYAHRTNVAIGLYASWISPLLKRAVRHKSVCCRKNCRFLLRYPASWRSKRNVFLALRTIRYFLANRYVLQTFHRSAASNSHSCLGGKGGVAALD
jgi:hypothetical protein